MDLFRSGIQCWTPRCPTWADTTPQISCRCWERFGWSSCRQCRCKSLGHVGTWKIFVFTYRIKPTTSNNYIIQMKWETLLSSFSMCFHHRVIPLGLQSYFWRFVIPNGLIQTRNSMLDPPDAQLGLTRHRSFLAGAGSALVESTADNAGANLWIMFGNSNEWKIFGFWVD